MTRAFIPCALCGEPITSLKTAWKQTQGWVSPRGAKAMTASQPTGALAHAECITLLKAGVGLGQERMV